MKKLLLSFIGVICVCTAVAQTTTPVVNAYQQTFDKAYVKHPEIPRGILEGVSFTMTRFRNITSFEQPSCTGLPRVYGPMGLTLEGQGYFKDNLIRVAELSGESINNVTHDPEKNILAFADAYAALMDSSNMDATSPIEDHSFILATLSELPFEREMDFAMASHVYSVYNFLANPQYQQDFGFPDHNADLVEIFGMNNLKILSSPQVNMSSQGVFTPGGQSFVPIQLRSPDYPPALWDPTPSCNYSSRNGTAISAITIHVIQGTYAGAISWAKNCNSNVSYHYVVRSSDGQVTQMVYESDKGWHVGSENPYTIGYEHEGYVSDPAWFTTAMFQSSAAISRDVVNSGYGINPLRTYYGPSSSGLNTLGGCTKIKGHQHYPNQSHTDPGIYWDWEYYYQLINNNPAIVTETTATGTWYDSGGPSGNYSDDERDMLLIAPSNATSVTISFSSFDLEANWDYMYIYDGSTTQDPVIGVYTGTNSPGTITATGGSILLEFRSDCATTNPGWEVTWTSNSTPPPPTDNTPPTSVVSTPSNWVTQDFTATFTDDDQNGSGVAETYYQVIDYDGTEWRANDNNGFFSDNFDQAIHADWTTVVGSWAINNGFLEQSDESESNTNIYAALDQNNDAQWLFHWAQKIGGSGTNKRAGFHFMSDDATLTNRGNSYFVWFREDGDKIQIYKVTNDVFSLEADIPFTIDINQWYDIKTTFDKTTGLINVYVDNELAASWTDPSPITAGDYISFRSGNAIQTLNNLKAYHSRGTSEVVTVGATGDIRYQNPNPLTPSGKVKTIVIDSANNVSSVADEMVNVDWTPPSTVTTVNDGTGADINVTTNNTELSANWTQSSDQHSDVARYWYAIGTTAGDSNVVGWTDNWFDDSVTHSGLNLTYGQTYYFSVRAENGAGLFSNITSSDGQLVDVPTNPPTASFSIQNTIICVGDSLSFTNSSVNASTYEWDFSGGTPSTSTLANPTVLYSSTGNYTVTLIATGPGGVDTTVQTITVTVNQPPIADFSVSDTIVYLPNAFVGFTNNSTNANGYSWDFADGNTSTDVNPWHIYSSPGNYIVMMVAVNNACPNDTAFANVEVQNATGIDESSEMSGMINVYPNPATDQATIFVRNLNEVGQLYIYDMTGRVVLQQQINTGNKLIQINPESLSMNAGMYHVVLRTARGDSDERLIIR